MVLKEEGVPWIRMFGFLQQRVVEALSTFPMEYCEAKFTCLPVHADEVSLFGDTVEGEIHTALSSSHKA